MPETDSKLLKKDLFGQVSVHTNEAGDQRVVRDTSVAPFWTRWIARRLLAREGRALAAADGLHGVPELLHCERDRLERTFVSGLPMQLAHPPTAPYFRNAHRLLRQLHRLGIVHNDLAKEPNLLVTTDGSPAFIDFQLAWFAPRRSRLFRLLAREDLRHLLKHKRTYCPHELTKREHSILATPSWPSRLWRVTGKKAYLFITRRLLGWADREGASDRRSVER